MVYVIIGWVMVYMRHGIGEFKRSALSSVAARESHKV